MLNSSRNYESPVHIRGTREQHPSQHNGNDMDFGNDLETLIPKDCLKLVFRKAETL
jgi:hypothetical protein